MTNTSSSPDLSSDTLYDVVGIGNAIVDVLTSVNDDFLHKENLLKGSMQLVDGHDAARLYGKLGQCTQCSGGSTANTIAGLASLGAKTAFIGKIHNDQMGQIFAHDMRSMGVTFNTVPTTSGPSTARCMVLITPDAQRTMSTHLGASNSLHSDDIDKDLIASAKVTYLEGYLWDPEDAKEAFVLAMRTAHAAGRKVAMSLSDPFCVGRYRDEFLDLVENQIDILFANELEIMSLFQVEHFNDAVERVKGQCEIAVLTRSAKGCVIVCNDEVITLSAAPVHRVVDTTGAGDLFAAGFLYGYTGGKSLRESGIIGNLIASEIISHRGARPDINLKDYLEQNMPL